MRRRWAWAAVSLAAGALVAACGSSGGGDVVRTGGASVSTAPSSASTSAPASSLGSSHAGVHPSITVTPSTKLVDGQIVNVDASGFSPHENLTVVQCADKGTATGSGDCNIDGMVPAQTDGDGKFVARIPVLRGPFGTNRVTCNAQQACLISVTQATLKPTEEADAPITFLG